MLLSRLRPALWLGVLGVTVALSGCASTTTPVSTPMPSRAASESMPSTTPTTSVPGPAGQSPTDLSSTDPADWVISFRGAGPFDLGGSLAAEVAAAAPAYEMVPAGSCPNPTTSILRSEANPTIWLQSTAEGSDEVALIAVGGDVLDDARTSGSPRTEEGIGVGSSLDEVRAAYPAGSLEETAESEPSRFLVDGTAASGGARYLVFGFYGDIVQTIFVQTNSEVVSEFCG